MNWFLRFIAIVAVLSASISSATANPKRIMILQSSGQNFKPWSEYVKGFRQELERQSPIPIEVQSFPVVIASGSESAENRLAEYLNALFSSHPPDLIVAFGAPAAAFAQRHRRDLFPSTPMLLTAIDQRRVQQMNVTENDTVVAVWIDVPALFENILKVLPRTKTIAVVIGSSPNEQFWVQEMKNQLEPLKGRVDLLFWNELSFEEILKQAATLPKDSAIFWIQPQIDVTGAVHEGERALKRLYAVANSPIFSHDDSFFAGEIVGGPMTSVSQGSQTAAAVAAKILGGTKPRAIETPVLQYGPAKYDWRELRRWAIPESRLPKGSEILFREPTLWELYRWQILAICAAVLSQAAMITGLLYQRRRRFLAEVQARQRMSELARINRYSMAGELCTSIAHELNQPLGAILLNAETMEQMLRSSPLSDATELLGIVSEIRRDDERAGKVLQHIRSLVRRVPIDVKPLDLNEVVSETLDFLSSLAIARKVQIRHSLAELPLPVKGDYTQLQQVLLNLVVNALDATAHKAVNERVITVQTKRSDNWAEFSTADTGPGVPPEQLSRIFEPFFSTKPNGMGMGLSIARTIVEFHGGIINIQNRSSGGAIVIVRLPLIR
ncbi:ABC transporter substrate binding protein [Bradyrhizobium sp. RDI18]|uniref:sensor histidine kinase n=1 Tax=Bradyrhizobium sp. RDI18 TaxID=3367400 RepID=UPI003715BDAE